MEQWKAIPGWDDFYEVSCRGRIRRIASGQSTKPGRLLAANISTGGYLVSRLNKPGKTKQIKVHVAVAEAFLGPRPPLHEVNHKDGNRANASLENLEYVTRSENNLHAYRILGRKLAKTCFS